MAWLGVNNEGTYIKREGYLLSGMHQSRRFQVGSQELTHGQLYLPASRVYCVTQSIPFHVTFSSSAFSLAAFLPYGPTATILAPNKVFTRIRVLRQSTVDVRYVIRREVSGPGNFTMHSGTR